MRPRSIVRFEWLSLLSLALAGVITLMTFGMTDVAVEAGARFQIGLIWIAYAIVFALMLLLILLVSRRADVVAKWILIILIVAGLILTLRRVPAIFGQGLVGILELVQVVTQAAALYFLFTPEARRWFSERAAARSSPSP